MSSMESLFKEARHGLDECFAEGKIVAAAPDPQLIASLLGSALQPQRRSTLPKGI